MAEGAVEISGFPDPEPMASPRYSREARALADARFGGIRFAFRFCRGFLMLTLIAQAAAAVKPALPIGQLIHNGWTARQGYAISAVHSVAQSGDGYLWLGTGRGLVRFNGSAFSNPLNSPHETIPAMIASRDGGLWIATAGGAAHWNENRLTLYQAGSAIPNGAITAMAEDRAGALWIATANAGIASLTVIRNGAATPVKLPPELPRAYITALEEDSSNRFWIGTAAGVCRWQPGTAPSCWLTAPPARVEALQVLPTGAALLDSSARAVRIFANERWGPAPAALQHLNGALKTLLTDSNNCLWIGTVGDGLLRSCNGAIEQFSKRDGLTSDLVLSLMQDREGNVWVGTSNGLDRFREPKAVRISKKEGLAGNACTAVCAVRSGGVWVGSSRGGLDFVNGRSITHYGAALRGATVLSLHEDASGTLWLGSTSGLYYRSAMQLVPVRTTAGRTLERIVAMADFNGVLWAADADQGLFRVQNHHAEPETAITIPRARNIFSLYVDRAGELCIGYFQGGMTIYDLGDGRASEFAAELPGGAVQAIFQDSTGSLWVGADRGLSRRRNGRWTKWDAPFGPGESVEGIAGRDGGDLWMLTGAGLMQVKTDAAGAIPDSTPSPLPHRVLGPADGIEFPEARRQVYPRLAQSQDGAVWASTDDGLLMVDPSRLNIDSIPPAVAIEEVRADGKPVSSRNGALAFHSRQTEFQFAVLSLGAPESADVRYRLEGFDDQWRDASGATRIAYGPLPPATYRFHVIAANADGVWNREGAVVEFRSLPEFYQTAVFQALCAAALIGLAAGLYRLRMSFVRSTLRVALAERTRVARELHDTLLQGFAGTMYLLKAASLQMNSSSEAGMHSLERAIEQGDQSLKEARQSLGLLRLIALVDQSLPEALHQAGKQILEGSTVKLTMDVTGKPRPLPHEIEGALFLIGREAMNNALAHGRPSKIRLLLAYRPDRIQLVVEDDGVGFDPAEGMSVKDHWGLIGIRERVKALGGHLVIHAEKSRGVRIDVTVPASSLRALHRRARVE